MTGDTHVEPGEICRLAEHMIEMHYGSAHPIAPDAAHHQCVLAARGVVDWKRTVIW